MGSSEGRSEGGRREEVTFHQSRERPSGDGMAVGLADEVPVGEDREARGGASERGALEVGQGGGAGLLDVEGKRRAERTSQQLSLTRVFSFSQMREEKRKKQSSIQRVRIHRKRLVYAKK